jgi:hypothetical protein
MLDDFRERMPTSGQIDRRELALEDRVLQMVAEVAHGLEDLAEAFVVADVVANEKSVAHGLISQGEQHPCSESPAKPFRRRGLAYTVYANWAGLGINYSTGRQAEEPPATTINRLQTLVQTRNAGRQLHAG